MGLRHENIGGVGRVGEEEVADQQSSQRQHHDLSGDPIQGNAHARSPDPFGYLPGGNEEV